MKRLQIPQKHVKFYAHEIAAANLSKIYFLKNATKKNVEQTTAI